MDKSDIRLELNSAGIAELLSSSAVASVCQEAAEAIAARAGDGFEVMEPMQMNFGGGRVGVGVQAATYEAKLAEATDKVLSKAVRG